MWLTRLLFAMGTCCSGGSRGEVSWKTAAHGNNTTCKWWLTHQHNVWHVGRLQAGLSLARLFLRHMCIPARATSDPRIQPWPVIRGETPRLAVGVTPQVWTRCQVPPESTQSWCRAAVPYCLLHHCQLLNLKKIIWKAMQVVVQV